MEQPQTRRILSIDALRGLNIFIMIWANALNERNFKIEALPEWVRHSRDGLINFPDVIWPAFTCIVGMSIPIAIENRLKRGQSYYRIWGHILLRAAGMMLLGIIMGEIWGGYDRVTPLYIGANLWAVLAFSSFFLIWSDYRPTTDFRKKLYLGLRLAGIALLIVLAVIFRKGEDGNWFKLRWWILGSLGWAYLISCLIYFIFRGNLAAMIGSQVILLLVYMGYVGGSFNSIEIAQIINRYVSIESYLSLYPFMAMSGLIIGKLFLPDSPAKTHTKRLLWMFVMMVFLFTAGFLLKPVYESSGRGTSVPWGVLYSMGYTCMVFMVLYLLIDVWQKKKWAWFFIATGFNPLMPFLISRGIQPLFRLMYSITENIPVLRTFFSNTYLDTGMPGVARNLAYTLSLLLFCVWTTKRLNYRLRL